MSVCGKIFENHNLALKHDMNQSIGFKLKNIYACPNSKDLCYVTGQTFYLFDNFILWSWIS